MMNKKIFIAALSAALAVILGAMGAHALENSLSRDALESFNTGVRYQMYHSIVLLILAFTEMLFPSRLRSFSYWMMLGGITLFSGSIYLLATKSLSSFSVTWLGPVTPIGGLILIISWLIIAFSAFEKKKSK